MKDSRILLGTSGVAALIWAASSGCALIAGLKDGELAPDGGSGGATTSSSSGGGGKSSSSSSSSSGAGGSGGTGGSSSSSSGTTSSSSSTSSTSTSSSSSSSSSGTTSSSSSSSSTSASSTSSTSSSSSSSSSSSGTPTAGMVLLAAGSFHMGCNEPTDTHCVSDEKPFHVVTLSQYEIDVTEVPQSAYKACVDAAACPTPSCGWDPAAKANYPVVCVTWQAAHDYCAWAGKRLPTEAEWENAARADTGVVYPWGTLATDCSIVNGNLCKTSTNAVTAQPSGASIYGVLNMSGNAAEWVNDYYFAGYYAASPATNPQGPAAGGVRVIRGGSWNSATFNFRTSTRASNIPTTQNDEIGFRCAK